MTNNIIKNNSFLERYCNKREFIDKKLFTNEELIDVIIPLLNTNPVFERNLYSFYREIPINNLIIGDGGCTDDSIEIVKKFPRVKIINQKNNQSLGYSIAELISMVKTEWFVYLHSDVYLPKKWYDIMKKYHDKYDWYECDRRLDVMIEYNPNIKNRIRPYSGSQMGRKKAFEKIIKKIDDDFLYRNEDIILGELIQEEGFKYGSISDTFHYHQIMNKKGEKEPKFDKIKIKRIPDRLWEIRVFNMQARGIIKYLKPKPYLIKSVESSLQVLQ